MIYLVGVFFAWAVFATAAVEIQRSKRASALVVAATELASYKRVGTWYEHRVDELENETRQLAEQVVSAGGIIKHAMPLQAPDPYAEYRSDPTGLMVEQVNLDEYVTP